MTVYVDDMYRYPMGEFTPRGGRTMKMSHMIADTTEELLAMAAAIGVQAKWIQKRGTTDEHFDIALGKRALAVKAGAVQITLRQCSFMCTRRRRTGILGTPEEAERWADNLAVGEAIVESPRARTLRAEPL